uniref:UPF3 domain-containing protein n=1 Tax=Mycena chlorophos TaxID=658473 RepID=A0ABQ0LFH4_MYCCL|nr:predicted protein [Mycena chlorophos]
MSSQAPPAGTGAAPPAKTRKEREREKKERQSQAAATAVPTPTERLKIVVRRLPPNLPEEIFWQSVQPWVTDETVSWKVFYPGKLRKRLNKENISSRAYILFKTEEQLALFAREYDGHLFRDKAGNEAYAVVEFAPYQKVASEKKKVDARSGTIDKDEDYISFLESLNAPPNNGEPASLEALIAASQPPPPPKTTPLLEALKADKSAKEAAMKQIAQQKRDDLKKKNAAALAANGPPMSKKAAKKAAAAAAAAASAQAGPSNKPAAGPSNAKSVPPNNTAKPPPKAPKGPKAAIGVPAPAPVASTSAAASAAAPNPSANGTIPNDPSATVAPKRARPVIGIASRQFEAALSGAGVAASGERKSRRERERERAAAAVAAANANGAVAPEDSNASPKKDKHVRRKDSVSTVSSPTSASGSAAPAIVHRIDDDVVAQPQQAPAQPPQAGLISVNIHALANNNAGRGGRRGGRGGGGPMRGHAHGHGRGTIAGGVPVGRVHGGG